MLIMKLDNMLNEDKSIQAQKQAILDKKSADRRRKQNKLALLKQKWKEREDIKKNI